MLLSVRDLTVSVRGPEGSVTILDRVSMDVDRGAAIGVVGESGSGKSLLALACLALPPAGSRVLSGTVKIDGSDIYQLRDRDIAKLRGGTISLVFQEPSSALNPVYTVGAQVLEAIHLHTDLSRKDARALAEKWLANVGLPRPAHTMNAYPHELSGGMKQRALLAMALATGPALLVADEPTSQLDRTLEAQILELLVEQRKTRNMAFVLVSHDLAAIAGVTEQTYVMYAGEVVEHGPTLAVLTDPQHPYTQALIGSIPDPSRYPPRKIGGKPRRLPVLRGAPPVFSALPVGCRFAPRCDHVHQRCRKERPPLYPIDDTRSARCFLVDPANLVDSVRQGVGSHEPEEEPA